MIDIPSRIKVRQVLESRYNLQDYDNKDLVRPLSWDQRISGVDVVETSDNQTLRLNSNGAQPVPQSGWDLLIYQGDADTGYQWTLYGMEK